MKQKAELPSHHQNYSWRAQRVRTNEPVRSHLKGKTKMDVEELQKEESNNTEVLSDLSVTNEQASKASGGTDTFSVNFAAIKYSYKPQKPDGALD